MKSILKKLLTRAVRFSGLPFLVRELVQRNKVTILVLHDMPAEKAGRTFAYLNRHYNIIGLNDFLKAHRQKKVHMLPPKALIITFDDGHVGNYDLLPVLKKQEIPLTVFLCAGIVDSFRHYWFLFKHPDIETQELKKLPNQKRLQTLQSAGFSPTQEFSSRQALNHEEIEALKPYINFQGHTVFHPCLPTCQTDEAREEIQGGKTMLEEKFELNINALAYPNGDYSNRDIQLAQEAGYEAALTVDFGYNTEDTDPFRLKRLSIDDQDNLDAVALKASGIWGFFKTRNGMRQGFGWSEPYEEPQTSTPFPQQHPN